MTTTTSRVTKTGAIKLGFAALATAALTIGGLTPAYAADYQLGPADIAGFENGDEQSAEYNYDQWHIGSTTNPEASVSESLEFNECSVTVLRPSGADFTTQVLKGYPIDARPSTTADIRAAIESISVDVESGSVTIQLPVFSWYSNADGTVGPVWEGTWRNADPFTGGVGQISGDTVLINSERGVEAPLTLTEVIQEMDDRNASFPEGEDAWYELLGIGFTGSAGTEVKSIGFDGNTHHFGTGDCLPEVPVDPTDPTDPVDPETPAAPKKPVAVETGL